jgi:hypothetical protein
MFLKSPLDYRFIDQRFFSKREMFTSKDPKQHLVVGGDWRTPSSKIPALQLLE